MEFNSNTKKNKKQAINKKKTRNNPRNKSDQPVPLLDMNWRTDTRQETKKEKIRFTRGQDQQERLQERREQPGGQPRARPNQAPTAQQEQQEEPQVTHHPA